MPYANPIIVQVSTIKPSKAGPWVDSARGIYMGEAVQDHAIARGWEGPKVGEVSTEEYFEAWNEAEAYLDTLAPEGYWFGNHPDNGDFGLWKDEEQRFATLAED